MNLVGMQLPSEGENTCTNQQELVSARITSFPISYGTSNLTIPGLEIKFFFQGTKLHHQKLPKGVLYRNKYIFGLPADI